MTQKYQSVFLDKESIKPAELDFAKFETALPGCKYYENSNTQETLQRLKYAEIVVTNKVRITKEIMKQALNLKLISVIATGYNIIDVEEANKRGIVVCNARLYGTQSVVQHVFMLMLALTTNVFRYSEAVKSGKWHKSDQFCLLDYRIQELSGKTLGIIGYGELGKAVVQVSTCFGMRPIIAERKGAKEIRPGRVSFEETIRTSDFISLHCPLTPETTDLIGAVEFKKMKSNAIIINAARGGIVNEAALKDALINGRIAGAGVDVLTAEPPKRGNVLLHREIPNLIVTPHVAWASVESRQRLLDQVAENVQAFLDGVPQNIVLP